MVKGSTIQLISKGQQDLFLTGNPKITFWKMVYRRHTQFAIESIRNNFNIKPVFGETIVSEIKRSGDLLNKMYFVVTLPPLVTSEIFKENPIIGSGFKTFRSACPKNENSKKYYKTNFSKR